MTKSIFITGTAGFIEYHLAKKKVDVLIVVALDFLLSHQSVVKEIGMRARKLF